MRDYNIVLIDVGTTEVLVPARPFRITFDISEGHDFYFSLHTIWYVARSRKYTVRRIHGRKMWGDLKIAA